ncbi:uncharacterized protein METZ01_LOCUS426246, partial [marine metagenome]
RTQDIPLLAIMFPQMEQSPVSSAARPACRPRKCCRAGNRLRDEELSPSIQPRHRL